MNQLEKLNALAKEAGYDDIFPHGIIVEPWEDSTSTTTIFDKDQSQPFVLNPITAVRIKTLVGQASKVPSDYKGVVAIHRAAVSIVAVSHINNVADLKMILNPIINAGIIDLTNQIGCINPFNSKVSMRLPSGDYFKLMEDVDGYELRLSVIKE